MAELRTTAEQRAYFRDVWNLHTAALMIDDIETLIKQRDGLVDDINKAMERVKKLEETLKWYAEAALYIHNCGYDGVESEIDMDCGKRAREALGVK